MNLDELKRHVAELTAAAIERTRQQDEKTAACHAKLRRQYAAEAPQRAAAAAALAAEQSERIGRHEVWEVWE